MEAMCLLEETSTALPKNLSRKKKDSIESFFNISRKRL